MTKTSKRSLGAGTAIFAALALGTTALAQEVTAPPADPPAAVTDAAPVDPPAAATIAPDPATVAAPAPAASRTAPATPRPAAPRVAHRAMTPAPIPSAAPPPRTPRPGAPESAPVAALAPAPLPSLAPSPAPIVAPAAPVVTAPATEPAMTRSEVATLGLLGLAALAGASMIGAGMIRRRRRTVYTDEGAVIADPPVAEAIGEAEPDISPAETAPTMPSAWAAGSTTAASPERFVMPEGPVPLGAERDALLSRMVAAPPDEANPFRSRKARLRRARMILATRERDLKANASKPFDWRTYEPSTKRAVVPAEHQVIG